VAPASWFGHIRSIRWSFLQIKHHLPLVVGVCTNHLSQIELYPATAAANQQHHFRMTTQMTTTESSAWVGCRCSQDYPCATSVLNAYCFSRMGSALRITYCVSRIAHPCRSLQALQLPTCSMHTQYDEAMSVGKTIVISVLVLLSKAIVGGGCQEA
jgi:hypothetical protein